MWTRDTVSSHGYALSLFFLGPHYVLYKSFGTLLALRSLSLGFLLGLSSNNLARTSSSISRLAFFEEKKRERGERKRERGERERVEEREKRKKRKAGKGGEGRRERERFTRLCRNIEGGVNSLEEASTVEFEVGTDPKNGKPRALSVKQKNVLYVRMYLLLCVYVCGV